MRLFIFFWVLTAASVLRAEAPRVVTDIAPVHGLVSQVMEGVGAPELVIPPGASPHGYAMRPSEARALSRAHVVFWVGPVLTPWLADPIDTLAPDARHVSLAQAPGIRHLPLRSGARFEPHDHAHGHADTPDHAEKHGAEKHGAEDHAHDDHAHGGHDHEKETTSHDDHGADHGLDSHLWLDPENARLWLAYIAEELAAHDPENAATYRKNAEAAQSELVALESRIEQQLRPLQGRQFIVFHDGYHYFEARFGVEAAAAVTLGDAGTASAARLAAVRDVVAETGALCALAEPRANAGLIDAVAQGAEIKVVRVDAVGVDLPLGPGFYPELLRQIAKGMVACLS